MLLPINHVKLCLERYTNLGTNRESGTLSLLIPLLPFHFSLAIYIKKREGAEGKLRPNPILLYGSVLVHG